VAFFIFAGNANHLPAQWEGGKNGKDTQKFLPENGQKSLPKNLQSDVRAVQKGVVAGGATDGQ